MKFKKFLRWLENNRPIITTKKKQDVFTLEVERTWADFSPVIYDLEKLRATTWDKEKITPFYHKLLDAFVDDIQEMRNKGLSKSEISKQLKCTWATLHKFMKIKGIE